MTIDERLEALLRVQENDHERIDALARNMELLVHMHMDNEKRAEARHEQNEAIHAEMMLALARLSYIAQDHDSKLDKHGERIDRLEDR